MKGKFLVIDTETTGTDPNVHSLLSLGLVIWEDGLLGPELELRIWEQHPVIDPESMALNKISLNDHRLSAMPPREAFISLKDFILENFGDKRVTLIAHNAAFDIGFLRRLFRLSNEDFGLYFSHRSIDTASILRFFAIKGALPEGIECSSSALEYFGLRYPGDVIHDALIDARATGRLLTKLLRLH